MPGDRHLSPNIVPKSNYLPFEVTVVCYESAPDRRAREIIVFLADTRGVDARLVEYRHFDPRDCRGFAQRRLSRQ